VQAALDISNICPLKVKNENECLGDGMTGITNHGKKSEYEEFGEAVKSVSSSICGLVEAAAQAAYLVGVSEPSSVAGRPGLVDQAQFARAAQSIQTACQHLTTATTNQQQVSDALMTFALKMIVCVHVMSFLNFPVTVFILFLFSYLLCIFGLY
jgi:talin